MRILTKTISYSRLKRQRICFRQLTVGCTGRQDDEPTNLLKKHIEDHWMQRAAQGTFDPKSNKPKFYVLSMFPYPSGNLHMGHVRVYTISDTMARYYRMNGKNVFHPIGWDAFGLPAENAAIQRKIEPSEWTKLNISQMKEQLTSLGYSFDWNHELATCDPEYFKWTQWLFLKLFENGLVYQKEALVNWDPVDKTVLADEQVDANGNSWRSGAKVEKKLLKQWFIRSTKFAKNLLEGLENPTLQDWRDIINLQKHWIGECNGYAFELGVFKEGVEKKHPWRTLRVWTEEPEKLNDPGAFILAKSTNVFHKLQKENGEISILNPFTNEYMKIIFNDNFGCPDFCDVRLLSPNSSQEDKNIANEIKFSFKKADQESFPVNSRQDIVNTAQKLQIGGYPVSSKLQDWLISRQRHWGTPIPIVHCHNCGAVPVKESALPFQQNSDTPNNVSCPQCGSKDVKPETDTMDTFVDSSWYYLRYLDAKNDNNVFDEELVKKFTPVDLYIGGKEHAVLHLYYARFMNHFIHFLGMVPESEPFKRLLVQGMVMGRSYRVKGTGEYIKEDEIEIVDKKKNKAVQKSTGKDVVMMWEKMSKSKLNGVDPTDMVSEYGADTTRLIILGDVAPTSHRNWSSATFPGLINWQRRIWLTMNEFHDLRHNMPPLPEDEEKIRAEEEKMFDARNYYVKGATFNYKYSHQLSVAISKMQGLTNSIRRCSKAYLPYLKQYERALACQIIMLAPMAPHFASELWARFASLPNRVDPDSDEINWNEDVLCQRWPDVDMEYNLDLTFRVNGFDTAILKMPRYKLDVLKFEEALLMAQNNEAVLNYIKERPIKSSRYEHYPGCEAIVHIMTERNEKESSQSKKTKKECVQ